MRQSFTKDPAQRKIPLWAMAAIGAGIGIVFPFVASLVEVLIQGKTLNGQNILGVWQAVPALIRFGAPFLLGTLVLILVRVLRKSQTQEAEYSQSLLTHSQTLEVQNRQLRQLNEALDGLVYTASHDLKTPIVNFQSLVTMLKTLRQEPDSEQVMDEVIARLEHSVGRFQETIAGLMDVSRLNRAEQQAAEPISLATVTGLVIQDLEALMQTAHGQWTVAIPAEISVKIHQASLYSVLQNLFTNAIKYARPEVPPQITVRACREGQQIVLTVADNGQGMDLSQDPEKPFRMFTRLTLTSEGSGVGLYIVKRSVEAAGGTVSVESAVGQGTVFRVVLPGE